MLRSLAGPIDHGFCKGLLARVITVTRLSPYCLWWCALVVGSTCKGSFPLVWGAVFPEGLEACAHLHMSQTHLA
jgi:hypothetical protein